MPPGMESGLEESFTYDHPYTTLPSADRSDLGVFYPIMGHACHIAVMEVDPDTGRTSFLDYVAVHDAGTMVNPKSLGGHVTGGAAQGLGSTLYEELAYDDEGQFKSSTFLDYLVPTANEVPSFRLGHVETPSPFTSTASRAAVRAAAWSRRPWSPRPSTTPCGSTACGSASCR
jgi:CO/xanthine dehydrogenase Mo-binding subunit